MRYKILGGTTSYFCCLLDPEKCQSCHSGQSQGWLQIMHIKAYVVVNMVCYCSNMEVSYVSYVTKLHGKEV